MGEAIFTNYRIFFRIPLAVQVAQCGVLANLIGPVTLMTMIDTTTEAPVTTTTVVTEELEPLPETSGMASGMDTTSTTVPITTEPSTTEMIADMDDTTTMTCVFTEFAEDLTMEICDSDQQFVHKTSAFVMNADGVREDVELFHYNNNYQWFDVRTCTHTHDGVSPIGCSQRYFPQKALTIRQYGEKFLVSLELVYVESGCEVDIFQ